MNRLETRATVVGTAHRYSRTAMAWLAVPTLHRISC